MAKHIKVPEDRVATQITDYLYKDANSALMLTATWGAGKTYYLKNHYFPSLKDTGFVPILVSLFGINAIDDIKDRIQAELYPLITNKYLRMGGAVIKALVKSADLTAILGKGLLNNVVDNAEALIKEGKHQHKNNIDFSNLLICFDDLERISEHMLTSNQLLGYINTLTEGHNIKILLVANYDKIKNKRFKSVKEKTISSTVHFQQNEFSIFQSVVSSTENKDELYFKHIENQQEIIEQLLSIKRTEQMNLRTLKYFLNYYYDIAHFIMSGTGSKELDKMKNELLTRLMKFSLFICIEFKRGTISFESKSELEKGHDYQMRKYFRKEGDMKTLIEELLDFYFENDDFTFYESIHDYLTGGNIFDKQKLVDELKIQFRIQDDRISESYKIYHKLSSTNYLELSDKEIKAHIKQLRSFALRGQFLYRDYLTVFYYILRDGNILNLSEEKLCRDFIRVLKTHAANHQYDSILDRYLNPEKESPFYEFYQKLKTTILEINKNRLNKDFAQMGLSLEKKLMVDFEGLVQEIMLEIKKPFNKITLSAVRPAIFFRIFKSSDNKRKMEIINLYTIICNGNLSNFTSKDRLFSKALLDLIKKHVLKNPPKNASGTLMKQLQEEVAKHIAQCLRFEDIY
ncbi:P-loop NTPase fold protein [Pedobacter aquatilis]|uniref:P-loop NTPase fold protein n=1 Tax=Pedobacter aquatilis TaxID=351343 RepID=UPI002931ED93|nr:P-loop NTPase fold protein [Pedobacter aquatilis]